jgi:hypothetical protein
VRCIIVRNVHSSVCELFGQMEARGTLTVVPLPGR